MDHRQHAQTVMNKASCNEGISKNMAYALFIFLLLGAGLLSFWAYIRERAPPAARPGCRHYRRYSIAEDYLVVAALIPVAVLVAINTLVIAVGVPTKMTFVTLLMQIVFDGIAVLLILNALLYRESIERTAAAPAAMEGSNAA